MSQFCRHNRFISECPICSKGTVLDPGRPPERRPRQASSRTTTSTRRTNGKVVARPARGPYAAAGPYGSREVRLEKVPGGLRLASWLGGQLERSAPLLALADLPALVAAAAEKELFGSAEAAKLDAMLDVPDAGRCPNGAPDGATSHDRLGMPEGMAPSAGARALNGAGSAASFGRSPGRSGELKDELRVEPLADGELRIARWVLRPNRGWELQEAPVLLPAARFAQALADAAARGLLAAEQPTA